MSWRFCSLILIVMAFGGSLIGCGGNRAPDPAEQAAEDREFAALRRLARTAFENGQYQQAVALYDKALARAFARDDLPAIGDLGFESSLALLRDGQTDQAVTRARETAAELRRRGATPFPALLLAEAAGLYAAHDMPAAARAADATRQAAAGEPAIRARANYILGMIAADTRDAVALDDAVAALGNPVEPGLRGDQQELIGRSHLLAGRPGNALTAFQTAADLRRETKDLTGVARALAFAGQAATEDGRNAEAADLYLRAGRSAQSNNRPSDATRWLTMAAKLAEASGAASVLTEARARLSTLSSQAGDGRR